MDAYLTFAIIVGILLLISICFNIFAFYTLHNSRKREKERIQRIDHYGTPIIARITQVVYQKRQRNYIVFAQWHSRETGKIYNFQETFKFLRGILGFNPKIQSGDSVQVNIIFDEHTYRIKRR